MNLRMSFENTANGAVWTFYEKKNGSLGRKITGDIWLTLSKMM